MSKHKMSDSNSEATAKSSLEQDSMSMISSLQSETTLLQQLLSQVRDVLRDASQKAQKESQDEELLEILRLQKSILANTSVKDRNMGLKEIIHEEVTKKYINLVGVCVSTELLGKDSRKEIFGLQTQLSRLESGISAVSNQMEYLQDQVGQLKDTMKELKHDMEQIKQNRHSCQSQVPSSNVERLVEKVLVKIIAALDKNNSNGDITENELNPADGEVGLSAWANLKEPEPGCSYNGHPHAGGLNLKLRRARNSKRKERSNSSSPENLRRILSNEFRSVDTTMSAMSQARPIRRPTTSMINQSTRTYESNGAGATARIQHLLTSTRLRPRTSRGSDTGLGDGRPSSPSPPEYCHSSSSYTPSSSSSSCDSDSSWTSTCSDPNIPDTIAERVKLSNIRKAACSFKNGSFS